MEKVLVVLLMSWLCAYAFPVSEKLSADEAASEEFIERMYRKEIEEGDNAEEPLEVTKSNKHRNAKKKHLHGHFDAGLPFGHGFGSHGFHHGMDYPIHDIHAPIGYPIGHHGHGIHHGHDFHDPIGHPVLVSPGHGPELPIVFPHHHHHHQHPHHHPHHLGYYPEYMPLPYTMPLCVMDKDDSKDKDKKKDEKKDDKKEKGKKTKRQLVPCHYYGPPGAGWGAFTPGHTGAGWGAPYWY